MALTPDREGVWCCHTIFNCTEAFPARSASSGGHRRGEEGDPRGLHPAPSLSATRPPPAPDGWPAADGRNDNRPRGDHAAGPVVYCLITISLKKIRVDESLARRPRTPDPCVVRPLGQHRGSREAILQLPCISSWFWLRQAAVPPSAHLPVHRLAHGLVVRVAHLRSSENSVRSGQAP